MTQATGYATAALMAYVVTMSLGIIARYRDRSFGTWHHMLYALTCVMFVVSMIPGLRLPHAPVALVLASLPFTRPRRSRRHDGLAVVGLVLMITLVLTS